MFISGRVASPNPSPSRWQYELARLPRVPGSTRHWQLQSPWYAQPRADFNAGPSGSTAARHSTAAEPVLAPKRPTARFASVFSVPRKRTASARLTGKQPDIEAQGNILALFRREQIDQEGCQASAPQFGGDKIVARRQAARPAAVNEDHDASRSLRSFKHSFDDCFTGGDANQATNLPSFHGFHPGISARPPNPVWQLQPRSSWKARCDENQNAWSLSSPRKQTGGSSYPGSSKSFRSSKRIR